MGTGQTTDPVYKHLGNLSAVEPWAQVTLRCHVCRVEWIGCQDAAACPQCGDTANWEWLMELRKEVAVWAEIQRILDEP